MPASDSIKQLVSDKAEDYSRNYPAGSYSHTKAYTAGFTDCLQYMEGFDSWRLDNYVPCDPIAEYFVHVTDDGEAYKYTVADLREIYFNTLNKGK